MKVHFIAIGGSAMHNIAIALKRKGYTVTGSDDEIFDPSKSRLAKYDILPDKIGWDTDHIHQDLDAVILGMHARKDNAELKKALELKVPVYSFPEYIYEQTKDKKRVVIGGSHGKTSTTAMILHVMDKVGMEGDYMVGAQLDGFECMVKLSDAPVVILEGDEYLSSPVDRRPKFHLYQPHIGLITGIAWDHINVFPTFEKYLDQFRKFIALIEKDGDLIYFEGDETLKGLVSNTETRLGVQKTPYQTHAHNIENGITRLQTSDGAVPVQVFGDHNLQNLNGAFKVCSALGIKEQDFYDAIRSFKGASKRLELVTETKNAVMYKDYAHAPSKLKATTRALKQQFPDRELIACMELHTFSSLNKDFLGQYEGAMERADRAIVYYNPWVIQHKRLEPLSNEMVAKAFGGNVEVYTDSKEIVAALKSIEDWTGKNLLMMSSGNFDGIDFDAIGRELFE